MSRISKQKIKISKMLFVSTKSELKVLQPLEQLNSETFKPKSEEIMKENAQERFVIPAWQFLLCSNCAVVLMFENSNFVMI